MYLFTGRPARLQRQILFGDLNQENTDGNQYAREMCERLKRSYKIVKENVSKELEYRIKEYNEDDAKEFVEGKLVLIFLPQKKRGLSPKLTPGWSYPFIISKRISPVVYELTSLGWSDEEIKVVRGLSSIKIYNGPNNFNEPQNYDPKDFQETHDFDVEPEMEDEDQAQSAHQQKRIIERIRLPSGAWIDKDLVTRTDVRTDEYTN